MRTPLRVIVALATMLSLFIPAATGVAAAGVSLSPASGTVGSSFMVSGSGFVPNAGVGIRFNGGGGTQIGSGATDASGNLQSVAVTVPNVTGGTYQIFVTEGTNIATADFTVLSNLTVSPTTGAAGTNVNLVGTGFGATEQVNFGVDGSGVTSITSDGNGNFNTNVTLPSSLSIGQHTISAVGVSSGRSASVGFNVTSGAAQPNNACANGDDERPGNGFGDPNHCHAGSPGQNKEQDGRGNHGRGNDQGDNRQGDSRQGDDH